MRGQVTEDFMVSFSIYIVILISIFVLSLYQFTLFDQEREHLRFNGIAFSLGSAMNNVYLAGDNTTVDYTIQKSNVDIDGHILNVENVSDFNIISSANRTNLNKSKLVIKNNNGVINVD